MKAAISRLGIVSVFGIGALILSATGCRPHLDDVRNPSYQIGDAVEVHWTRMQKSIRDGLISAGWSVEYEEPGLTQARVQQGEHWAALDIRYTSNGYEFAIADSSDSLGFDGEYVHKRYTFWSDRLDRIIRREIAETIGLHVNTQSADSLANPQEKPPSATEAPPGTSSVALESERAPELVDSPDSGV